MPEHDGLAEYVGIHVPEAEVWSDLDVPSAALRRVEFFCAPYMNDSKAISLLEHLPAIRVLQTLSSGVDGLVDAVPGGVLLCNGRDLHHEESTAELAVLLILASLRELPRLVHAQQSGQWQHRRGRSLDGLRVLLVGYGAIGQAIEARLRPFGPSIAKVARVQRNDVASYQSLPQLAAGTDVLVVCVPLTTETHGLVDATVLEALPDHGLVVNVGRGPTVDNAALRAQLRRGRLRAALDVTDPEPLSPDSLEWNLVNVLVTPHVGGDTDMFIRRARPFVAEQVARYLRREPLRNVVSR